MPDQTDFVRQLFVGRYNADRALELEIEKFSAGLERAFLQVAGLLNGASATVFLSFLGATADKVTASVGLTVATFSVWLLGLGLAILAGASAYDAQQRFLSASRNLRHASGLLAFGEQYRQASEMHAEPLDYFQRRADERQAAGDTAWGRARRFGTASIVLFIIGAVLALATIMSAVPAKVVSSH